jgi:hypothetical protein
LSDDRLYRFFLTQLITYLHMLLEYLAFRGDWAFFVGRQSFTGLSQSSLGYSVVRSLIIFLYLLDAGTSAIILFGMGKDILWNAWKLYKVRSASSTRQQEQEQRGQKAITADGKEEGEGEEVEADADTDADTPLAVLLAATTNTATTATTTTASEAELDARDSGVKHGSPHARHKLSPAELDRVARWCDRYATVHVGLCVYPLVIGMALFSMTYVFWYTMFFLLFLFVTSLSLSHSSIAACLYSLTRHDV